MPVLEGPTALVLAYDDISVQSKAVSDFARTSRILTIKGGDDSKAVHRRRATSKRWRRLPPREVLLGKFVGLLASPMHGPSACSAGRVARSRTLLKARAEQLGGGEALRDAD